MSKILSLLVLLASFHWTAFGLGCPDNSAELMRHFGRSLMPADSLASGMNTATDDKMKAAIEGIDSAMTCAKFTMCDEGLALLPERLRGAPEKYREYMTHFVALLESYKALFVEQQAVAEADRNFDKISEVKREIQMHAGRSHADLK